MMKKPKLFPLRTPSQLKQTLDCDFVTQIKNTVSSCKTHDATKKLYSGDTALVYKTHDASEQLSKKQ